MLNTKTTIRTLKTNSYGHLMQRDVYKNICRPSHLSIWKFMKTCVIGIRSGNFCMYIVVILSGRVVGGSKLMDEIVFLNRSLIANISFLFLITF